MEILKTKSSVADFLNQVWKSGDPIGFVPTMGALHQGHISLVERAKLENSIVTASIFVNPIQFNNPEDLKKYPRNIDRDLDLLGEAGCDLVFIPEVEEMYPETALEKYDFGYLENIMEGKYRPGHFNGVAVVVNRLFDIFKPSKSYLGEKDLQQLRIIEQLVVQNKISTEIIPCAIVREADGLAMSSRNLRLNPEHRKKASLIYQTLTKSKEMANTHTVNEIVNFVTDQFETDEDFRLEYFSIVDFHSLLAIESWEDGITPVGCIAAFLGDIRLIDNMILK